MSETSKHSNNLDSALNDLDDRVADLTSPYASGRGVPRPQFSPGTSPRERMEATQAAGQARLRAGYEKAMSHARTDADRARIETQFRQAALQMHAGQERTRQMFEAQQLGGPAVRAQVESPAPTYQEVASEPGSDGVPTALDVTRGVQRAESLPARTSVNAYDMDGVAAALTREAEGTGLGAAYGWPNDNVSFAWHPEANNGAGDFRVSAAFPDHLMPPQRPGDGQVVDANPTPQDRE